MKISDKYRGCLVGGAVGDALGYPVEFMDYGSIFIKYCNGQIAEYGNRGISEYELTNGKALISDDTQMTLFTANGLLLGKTRGKTRGIMGSYQSYVYLCYKDWYVTQTSAFPYNNEYKYSWLVNIPELFSRRAPGSTCLTAIKSNNAGSVDAPDNSSKGCGGIMRVAPVGLYFENDEQQDKTDMLGAEIAALTHGHELGYIPAAALVHIISLLSHSEDITLIQAVEESLEAVKRLFPKAKYLNKFVRLTEKAIALASEDITDLDGIKKLGEGWVAEETFAIAVYCSLKYQNDFEKAVTAAVNHGGDSDSTGAVTGNIMGAYLGLSSIPQKFTENLELYDVILEIADDLYNDCKISEYGSYRDEVWESKYIYCTYRPENLKTKNNKLLTGDQT